MRRLLALLLAFTFARAADVAPAPTHADIAYGPHERNRLDLWLPATAKNPAPLVIFIHGGGFTKGDKTKAREQKLVQQCLDAGVAFAAINYRFLAPDTPLPAILRDCARALQFLRADSARWNLDSRRVAVFGSSAGGGTSLWLAFHDDLADPQNPDPVLRQSTRVLCAGALSTQFSYDFNRWLEVFGSDTVRRHDQRYYAPGIYGFASEAERNTPAGRAIQADCDMLNLLTRDDPPIYLYNKLDGGDVKDYSHLLHHPKHTKLLHDRARALDIPVVADLQAYQLAPPAKGPRTLRDFLFLHLGVSSR